MYNFNFFWLSSWRCSPTASRSTNLSCMTVSLMAALIAKGRSEIDNIYQIERGYSGIEQKLRGLGTRITRVE